ncbi:MAG: hypothetical protein E6Q59_01620 [Nitrosomonas sp.]|nr:tyrosinase family protein [Nitrosomonas sp.]TXI41788.1 MAG: hypothetical protein E6Q59_01620 [Nitrosomonas sp.]
MTNIKKIVRTRLPLHEFVENERLLKALRKAVSEMKKRKPSDPLSWFYQAAIHGVSNEAIKEAAKLDSEVLNIDTSKYWNQCPHHDKNNSADFLPWHRAYTHFTEEIMRLHSEEDDFAIPYWDYSIRENRVFPREFGIEHLDGDTKNNAEENLNPLFHAERDYFLCRYEHPLTDQLPLTELSERAVSAELVFKEKLFFGKDETSGIGGGVYDQDRNTRGLLEQSPHDLIHRAVGGIVFGINALSDGFEPGGAVGSMAIPATAGFDPIFPVHHSNIDRIWALWSCMEGKEWGHYPSIDWFATKAWFFFDINGREVNRPRRDFFDYRALGISFKDEDRNCSPLKLPEEIFNAEELPISEHEHRHRGVMKHFF